MKRHLALCLFVAVLAVMLAFGGVAAADGGWFELSSFNAAF